MNLRNKNIQILPVYIRAMEEVTLPKQNKKSYWDPIVTPNPFFLRRNAREYVPEKMKKKQQGCCGSEVVR